MTTMALRSFVVALLLATVDFVRGQASEAAAEQTAPEDVVFRTWKTENGLPQNTVNAIIQTQDGFLWIGTRDGLARFDGVRFTLFGLREGLPSVEVQTLHEDAQGTLWIGTSGGGLSRWHAGRIETVSFPQYLAGSGTVSSLAEDAGGRLWIGTRAGLLISERGRFAAEGELARLSHSGVRALLQDRRHAMWIATLSEGLFEFHNNRLRPIPGPPGNELILAYCLLEDTRSNLWASVGNGTILCRHDGQWLRYTETNGLPFAYVTCLAEEASGTLWAGSLDDGLCCFHAGRFHAIRQQQGLSANDVRALCPDREGHLWVGTRTGGLNRLSRRKLTSAGIQQGLTNDYTRSVAETADGVLWVGTIGGGLYRGESGRFRTFSPFYASVESVLAVRDGDLWWGAARGLFHMRGGRLIGSYTNETWLGAAAVTALCEDNDGGLWAGTSEGRLAHFQDGVIRENPSSIAGGAITGLAQEPDGALWIGSMAGGLHRLSAGGKVFESYTNGLASQAIRTLRLDAEGVLWVGTAGGGLNRLDHGQVTVFGNQMGPNAATVVQIVEDDYGYLWLGTSRGVLRVNKSELSNLAKGKRAVLHPRLFGINEGMPAEECSSGFSPAGLKTKTGLICISTVKGLVFFDPRDQEPAAPPPNTIVEEILVNGESQQPEANMGRLESENPRAMPGASPSDQKLSLPAGNRELEFHYTAISFAAPEKIRFRYQLEGLDPTWVEAGEGRVANYHRVAPGRYHFRVLASTAEGQWSTNASTLAVSIDPYLWETTWFMALVALVPVGIVASVIRLIDRRRFRRHLAVIETRHAVERERLRISRDMHDDVGSILTQVSQLSDMGQSETGGVAAAKANFERIGTQARAAVRSLDEIVWATNPKNDNLPRFVEYICQFADELFENTPVRCWQEVPTTLPKVPLGTEVRHNVFLALKEAFNNVLKHSGATEVWLRLSLRDSEACVYVEDNGNGFEFGKTGQEGNGLENMKARLTECRGEMELRSSPGHGTKVCFRFPIPGIG